MYLWVQEYKLVGEGMCGSRDIFGVKVEVWGGFFV